MTATRLSLRSKSLGQIALCSMSPLKDSRPGMAGHFQSLAKSKVSYVERALGASKDALEDTRAVDEDVRRITEDGSVGLLNLDVPHRGRFVPRRVDDLVLETEVLEQVVLLCDLVCVGLDLVGSRVAARESGSAECVETELR